MWSLRETASLSWTENDNGKGQRPITVHDASNIFIDGRDRFAWRGESCDGSQLVALSTPPLPVSPITPIACGIEPTVSNFVLGAP
jgi:hypothetical protein